MQKVKSALSESENYLERKITEVRMSRLVGEVIWVLGSCLSFAGLFLKILFLMILGSSMLFVVLYLSVHYELKRVDYVSILERVSHQNG